MAKEFPLLRAAEFPQESIRATARDSRYRAAEFPQESIRATARDSRPRARDSPKDLGQEFPAVAEVVRDLAGGFGGFASTNLNRRRLISAPTPPVGAAEAWIAVFERVPGRGKFRGTTTVWTILKAEILESSRTSGGTPRGKAAATPRLLTLALTLALTPPPDQTVPISPATSDCESPPPRCCPNRFSRWRDESKTELRLPKTFCPRSHLGRNSPKIALPSRCRSNRRSTAAVSLPLR